jgi:hypothetical protein
MAIRKGTNKTKYYSKNKELAKETPEQEVNSDVSGV